MDNDEDFIGRIPDVSRGNSTKLPRSSFERPDLIEQAIPIPFYKIGWIVGKKGSYINQLCRKSGATVTVSESESREYGTTWKYVMVHGTGREVDRAKKLLHIRLDRYVPRTDQEVSTTHTAMETEDDGSGSNDLDHPTA